jgi:hypothetical protein
MLPRRHFIYSLPAVVCVLLGSESAAAPPPRITKPPRQRGKHQFVVHQKNSGWREFTVFLAIAAVGGAGVAAGHQFRRVKSAWSAVSLGFLAGAGSAAVVAVFLHWVFGEAEIPLFGAIIVAALLGGIAGARATAGITDSSN